MFFFGHLGITAGVVKACDILLAMTESDNSYQSASNSKFGTVISRKRLRLRYWLNGAKSLIGAVDYRLVLLGALLPDIIDKPVWLFMATITSDISLSGRGYTHTLLFSLILLIGGLALIRYGKSWLLVMSLATVMHLILDQIWNRPVVLWWSLLGPIPRGETACWMTNVIQGLFSRPEVYVPEIIGLVILLFFAYRLALRKSVTTFIRDGAFE